jgi:hypothetical protein
MRAAAIVRRRRRRCLREGLVFMDKLGGNEALEIDGLPGERRHIA